MTRINVIPVSELLDEHLRAEYREITRLWRYAEAYDGRPIPSSYRLGRGHVRFFIDKGEWVEQRLEDLRAEMLLRSFKVREWDRPWPPSLRFPWSPSRDDVLILIPRLIERIPKIPHFWRHRISREEARRRYEAVDERV